MSFIALPPIPIVSLLILHSASHSAFAVSFAFSLPIAVLDSSIADAPLFVMDGQWRMNALVTACSKFNRRVPVCTYGNSELVIRDGTVLGDAWPHHGADTSCGAPSLYVDKILQEYFDSPDKSALLDRWRLFGGGDINVLFDGVCVHHSFNGLSPENLLPTDYHNVYRLWCHHGKSGVWQWCSQ